MRPCSSSDRVLVTEDDENVRAYLSTILRASGLTPVEAPDGEAALALLGQADIDLLLLDVHLPGMDGFEVLRQVKIRTPGLPVVMLTGASSIPSAVQAVKDGADNYLEKPLASSSLLDAIHRSLAAAQGPRSGPRHGPNARGKPCCGRSALSAQQHGIRLRPEGVKSGNSVSANCIGAAMPALPYAIFSPVPIPGDRAAGVPPALPALSLPELRAPFLAFVLAGQGGRCRTPTPTPSRVSLGNRELNLARR